MVKLWVSNEAIYIPFDISKKLLQELERVLTYYKTFVEKTMDHYGSSWC